MWPRVGQIAKRKIGATAALWLLLEGLLLVASLGELARVVGAIGGVQAEVVKYRTAHPQLASEVGLRASILGLDAFGVPILRTAGRHGRHVVSFVVRDASFSPDVAYWRAVAAGLPRAAPLWLIGYCDGSACIRKAKRMAKPPFSLVAYGEVFGLESVQRADGFGRLIVTTDHLVISSEFPWRGHTPRETIDFLSGQQ